MKILFVTSLYPDHAHPTSGSFVKHQAEQLKQLGHQVDILHILSYRSKLNYFKAIFDVLFKTMLNNYDIVHAQYGPSGLPALFRWRTPLVITLHGSDIQVGKLQPFVSRFACRFADAVIVVSKKLASIIPGYVIPCGVDLKVFKPYNPVEARNRLGLPLKRYLILFPFDPGRKIKRYDLAQASVEQLSQKGYDIELVVVNNVKNEEMPWYYSAADAMILCSDSEGSPTSIKEAFACNTPVVCTRVGDIEESMAGIPGIMICNQDVESLANGIEQVLNKKANPKPDLRSAMQKFDQSQTVKSIVRVYEQVLKKG